MTTSTRESAGAVVAERPRSLGGALLSSLDSIPWWVLVLAGIGVLILLFILSPARVQATRKVPSLSLSAGRAFTYELTVRNEGPAEAVNIAVREVLPAGARFVRAEPSPEKAEETGLLWQIKALRPGLSQTIQVTVSFAQAGSAEELLAATQPSVTWTTVSLDILRFLGLGVQVTISVTIYSFLLAVVMGLIAGLGRVTKPPAGLRSTLRPRYAVFGLLRVAVVLGGYTMLARLWQALPPVSAQSALVLALAAYFAPAVLHPYTVSTVYVEVFRGVPMLVQVLYLGFVVRPFIKGALAQALGHEVEFSEFAAAVVGLGLGYGAYIAEVFRAGIQSIHHGQMEAARSLGMSYAQAMRYVILPQAVRRVLPPLANDGVALLKDSSFVSVLSVADLTRQGRLYMSRTYRAFESWNMVAVSYLVLTFLFSGIARAIERRMSQSER
jgi:polar amino acid transport system permease protein